MIRRSVCQAVLPETSASEFRVIPENAIAPIVYPGAPEPTNFKEHDAGLRGDRRFPPPLGRAQNQKRARRPMDPPLQLIGMRASAILAYSWYTRRQEPRFYEVYPLPFKQRVAGSSPARLIVSNDAPFDAFPAGAGIVERRSLLARPVSAIVVFVGKIRFAPEFLGRRRRCEDAAGVVDGDLALVCRIGLLFAQISMPVIERNGPLVPE
jgi:hypothetical protein